MKLLRSILVAGLSWGTIAAAQPPEIHFSKGHLTLGAEVLNIELAVSNAQQERGLMFRKAMPEKDGMLFVYKKENPLNFWMKNTFIPLSIGFFNSKKELIDMQDMVPVQSEIQLHIPTYESHGAAQYALEVNQGWFERHKIRLNTKFKLESDAQK